MNTLELPTEEKAKMLLNLFGPEGEHWCKNVFAKTKKGVTTRYNSDNADKFCLLGACYKLQIGTDWLYSLVPPGGICFFNDADGFPPVKQMLEDEIAERA